MSSRAIDAAERALWHEAMREVARRPATGKVAEEKVAEEIPATPAKAGAHLSTQRAITVDSGLRRNGETQGGLDRRTALRLKRGQMAIEARIDLHGMTQAEAHRALAGFVARSHAAGRRVLLVITGKGLKEGIGVLRAAVPRWLGEAGLRPRVLATAPAVPRDGGSGALYILLRRER